MVYCFRITKAVSCPSFILDSLFTSSKYLQRLSILVTQHFRTSSHPKKNKQIL